MGNITVTSNQDVVHITTATIDWVDKIEVATTSTKVYELHFSAATISHC